LRTYEIYALAIAANLSYSSASMVFSIYAKRFSSSWINQIKVSTAFLTFIIAMILSSSLVKMEMMEGLLLISSGFVGLCIGDIYLFRAFTTLGPARSLVLYSFQPLLLGVYGYFFLGQFISTPQIFAILCMIICIVIFMFERNKITGAWDMKSFLWALSGITLDAIGVMLSRQAFELNPSLDTFQVNVVRCFGALVGFMLISPKSYLKLSRDLVQMNKKEVGFIILASIVGCFLSLSLYLKALKFAHVGTLTAIAITGPIWVSLLECAYTKKWPNRYLVSAFSFFLLGFYLMISY
jgi:drug/metabolite transporter (DMT)-like permease